MPRLQRRSLHKNSHASTDLLFNSAVIGAVILLFFAFGMMVYGRFATSIGMMGMYNRVIEGAAFLIGGLSFICFGILLTLQIRQKEHVPTKVLLKEIKGIALGFLCYALPFVLVMAAISATDSMGAAGLVLAAGFAAIPLCYRRHRKQHPIEYAHTGNIAIVLLIFFLATASLAGGGAAVGETLSDLNGDYKQGTFEAYILNVDRPSARAALLEPTTYELDLYETQADADARRSSGHISVSEADWPEVERVLGTKGATSTLKWYPDTQVLIGARDNGTGATVGDPID